MVRTSAVIRATIAFSVASTLAAPMAVPQWDTNGLSRRSGEVVPGRLQRRYVEPGGPPTPPPSPSATPSASSRRNK